ncbi:MAG: sigma-70 family RNA polymerase sigma factor [Actinomycetota bacterium]|nr:sigma-70 family RNA polymerase sigma factor [Actinomycetota bacterium]
MSLPPFQEFLEDCGPDIWRFLVASVGALEAEDCWQETFMAALRAYPRLRPGSDARAWALKIAQRKAIDSHRARGRRAVPSDSLPETVGDDAHPDHHLWARVRELPPKQRFAIAHRYVLDLSYAQVGEQIGCSAEAARRNVHEGLKKLRKEWIDD